MADAQRTVASGSRAMQKSTNDLKLTFQELSTASGRSLRILAGAFTATFGIRAILGIADAAKQLTAQLKLATAEYGSLAQAQKDVRDIAQTTRSDLLATGELYSALQRSSGQLGTTQDQTARATKTVAEAFKISGAATEEQANATRQLVQAFQSGVLRGDEFNSVMENAPRLARLLADSLGITVGQLRALAQEGKLTADKLVRAFTDAKFTAALDEQFKQLPVTFDQAMGQLYNSAVIVLGEFDSGGEFSTDLANFFTQGSEGFDSLSNKAYKFGADMRGIFDNVETVRDAFGSLHTTGLRGLLGLEDATFNLADAIGGLLGVLDSAIEKFADLARAPYNLIQAITGGQFATGPITSFGANFNANVNARRMDATRRQIFGRTGQDVLAEFGLGRRPPPFRPAATKAKTKKAKKGPRDRSDDTAYQFQREQMQADLDVLRAKQDLAGSSGERAKLDLQILQLEHDMQQAEIDEKVRKAKRDFAEGKITAGTLKEVETQAATLKQRNDELTDIKLRAFAEQQSARQEQAIFEATDQRQKFAIDNLRAEDEQAQTQAEHRRIQLQILDAEFEQRRLELEHAKQLAVRNGATDQEIANIQAQIDNLATEKANARTGVINSTRGPMEDYIASLPTTADKMNEAFQRLEVQGFEGLIDAALALSEGFDNAKDALLNTLKEFALGVARLQLQKSLGSLLGGVNFGSLGSLFAGGFSSSSFASTVAGNSAALAGGLTGVPTTILGFASGGSFSIGGRPGIDRNVLSVNGIPVARVSRDERVSVSNDNQATRGGREGGGWYGNMYVTTPDANSFQRSDGQIVRGLRRKLR